MHERSGYIIKQSLMIESNQINENMQDIVSNLQKFVYVTRRIAPN